MTHYELWHNVQQFANMTPWFYIAAGTFMVLVANMQAWLGEMPLVSWERTPWRRPVMRRLMLGGFGGCTIWTWAIKAFLWWFISPLKETNVCTTQLVRNLITQNIKPITTSYNNLFNLFLFDLASRIDQESEQSRALPLNMAEKAFLSAWATWP